MTARIQVRQSRAHAHPIDVIFSAPADAGGIRVMHVGIFREVGCHAGPVKRLLHGRPGLAGKAAYGNRAVGAVEVIVEIGIVLQFPKVWQHLAIRPRRVARRCPGVKILWGAPDEGLAIDSTGTPDGFAPRHRHGRGLMRVGRPHEGPVVGRARLPRLQIDLTPAVLQHVREARKVREVRTCLQEQDGPARVL